MRRSKEPKVLVKVKGKINENMRIRMQHACQIMATRSWERGDAWKNTGMVGAFVEMYNCFMRVRKLVWENPPEGVVKGHFKPSTMNRLDFDWVAKLEDVLVDLRNFSILLELAMEQNIYHGSYQPGKRPVPFKRKKR